MRGKLMKLPLIAVLAVTGSLISGVASASSEAGTGASSPADPQTGQFIIQTVQQGMATIQYSQLVLQRSDNDELRQLAQRVLDTYARANREIGQLASQKGVFIPLELSAQQRYRFQMMASLSGQPFEEQFLAIQLQDQEDFVRALEGQLQNGSDEDVKSFAAHTLQQLQSHTGLVKALADQGQF